MLILKILHQDQSLKKDQEYIKKIKINQKNECLKNIIDRGDNGTTTDAPNTTTLPEAALQPTMTEQDKSRKVISVIDTLLLIHLQLYLQALLVTPTLQQVQTGETMATPGLTGTVVAPTPTAGTTPTISPVTGPTATQTAAQTAATPSAMTAAQVAGTTPTMTAAQATGLTAPAVAATGTIDADATVRGQLAKINQDIQTSLDTGSALPAYLRGVAKATQTAMAERGLSSSSMMAEALADGLLTASIPIAQADADTYKQMIFQNLNNRQQAAITNANNYFQMDMANLSNKQQASLQNLNVRQASYYQIKLHRMLQDNLMQLVRIK